MATPLGQGVMEDLKVNVGIFLQERLSGNQQREEMVTNPAGDEAEKTSWPIPSYWEQGKEDSFL